MVYSVRRAAVCVLLAAVTFSSALGAEQPGSFDFIKPGPDEAIVYFYRQKDSFTASRLYCSIYVDGSKVCDLRGGCYTSVYLEPGQHSFTTYDYSLLPRPDEAPTPRRIFNPARGQVDGDGKVQGGQIYYIEWQHTQEAENKIFYQRITTKWGMRQVPAPDAKNLIGKCRYVPPTVVKLSPADSTQIANSKESNAPSESSRQR